MFCRNRTWSYSRSYFILTTSESIRILTDNGIVLGSASAVLLNIVFIYAARKVKVEEPVSMQSAVRSVKSKVSL